MHVAELTKPNGMNILLRTWFFNKVLCRVSSPDEPITGNEYRNIIKVCTKRDIRSDSMYLSIDMNLIS